MPTTQEREGKPDLPRALYPKLRPKRNGPGREQVALDQRARLHAATVEALAMYGYAGTTVAKLIALAGVSRLTFYEHFSSKEACFLASYDEVVAEAAAHIMAACEAQQEGPARVIAGYAAFVSELLERPKAARLAIVDVLAVGPGALERVEQARLAFESTSLGRAGGLLGGVTPPELVLRGIFGGIWQIARRRLLTDQVQELSTIGGEILMWTLSYNAPAAEVQRLAPAPMPAARNLAPGNFGAVERDSSRGKTPEDERKRILHAAAELAAGEGYAELNTARIVQEARVSDVSFFEYFEGTEDCFLAALELLCVEALAKSLSVALTAPDWPQGIQRGVRALLEHIARDRTFARVVFVDVFTAGAGGLMRREEILKRAADMLIRYAPREQRPSPVVAEAIVGAIWAIAYDRVVRGAADELPGLAGYVSYMVLAPVIGADVAVQSILAEPLAAG